MRIISQIIQELQDIKAAHGDLPVTVDLTETPPGVALIYAERMRQQHEEGYTSEHDDQHTDGSIAQASAAYALSTLDVPDQAAKGLDLWPWKDSAMSGDKVTCLQKAGALIAAEIDRLLRVKVKQGEAEAMEARNVLLAVEEQPQGTKHLTIRDW